MKHGHLTSILVLLAVAVTASAQPLRSTSKMCKTIRVSTYPYLEHKNLTRLYEALRNSYGGCEYVYGDVFLENIGADSVTEEPIDDVIQTLSTDFLDSIVEITGKLFIKRVNLKTITFRNLRTIRGYNHGNENPFFAIDVMQSKYPLELRLPKLGAILRGNVRLIGNLHANLYCYMTRQVDWPSMFQSSSQRFLDHASSIAFGGKQVKVSEYSAVESLCSTLSKCDASCHTEKSGRQLCWSSGPDGCQSYHRCGTRTCRNNNCFRSPYTRDEECCDSSCLGGCVSEGPNGCFSCMSVSLEGSCRESCPTKSYYSAETGQMETLNSSMWQVGNMCMKKCVTPFVYSSDGKDCLSECPQTEIPVNDVCTSCAAKDQESCVTCNINSPILTDAAALEYRRRRCTIWLIADKSSLDVNAEKLNSTESLETLEIVQIFYGRLMIKRTHMLVNNLRFLRNIRHVSDSFDILFLKTSYLGLSNLQSAKQLNLFRVSGLCAAWFPRKQIEQLKKKFVIKETELSFDISSAACRNATCDPQCLDECWGPGPDMCVECRHFKVNGRCYATCQDAGKYQGNKTCLPCHSQCAGGCFGPAASDCVLCRHLRESGNCVATCSQGMRADSRGSCYSVALAKIDDIAWLVDILFEIIIWFEYKLL